jgi:tetratricopeptide (TPR) repeat protein
VIRRAPRVPRLAALLAVVSLAGCAYFNALYNARRLYDDAETAAEEGNRVEALAAYRESLEKAARSFEQDPDGRWADDALLLVGQNQFALGNCAAAEAALHRVVRETGDRAVASRARAYLGAALYCLEEPAEALGFLDQAVAGLDEESHVHTFARLWRARARFDLGQTDPAWADLEVAAARSDALGRAALLEQIARAASLERPDLAIAAFHRLLADPAGDMHADSITVLARLAGSRWGGATAREALGPAPEAPWAGEIRDRLIVERALHAALAGDTATAVSELSDAASRSAADAANAARVALARLRLQNATGPEVLTEIRGTLLPAIADQGVRLLLNTIGVIGVLLDQAAGGQPLALFAAAEVSRDRLHAPALARRLFVSYADVAGSGAWSTKALLAALALDPPATEEASLRSRFAAATDVYALAARGTAPIGFEDSEARLDQVLSDIIRDAERQAQARDVAVSVAIAEIDSITSAVRADSVALTCGFFADSLGLAGIRRDSVRAACLREDQLLVDSFLVVDTMLLRDTTLAAPREEPVVGDTSRL